MGLLSGCISADPRITDFPPPVGAADGRLPDAVLSQAVYQFETFGDETLISYSWIGPNYITVVNNKTGAIRHVPMVYRTPEGKDVVLGGGKLKLHNDRVYAVTRGGILIFDKTLNPVQLIYPPNTNFTSFLDWEGDWMMTETNRGLFLINEATGETKFLEGKTAKGRFLHRDGIAGVTAYRKLAGRNLLFTDRDGILEIDITAGTLVQLPTTIGVAVIAVLGVVENRTLLCLEVASSSAVKLYWFDGQSGEFSLATEFANVTPVVGFVDNAKEFSSVEQPLVFANGRFGLEYWDPKTSKVTWLTWQDGTLKRDWIYGLYDDGEYVWIGYADHGAQRIEREWLYEQLINSKRTIAEVVDSEGRGYTAIKAIGAKLRGPSFIPPGHESEMPPEVLAVKPSIPKEPRYWEKQK